MLETISPQGVATRWTAEAAWVGAHKRGPSRRGGQDRAEHGSNQVLSWVALSDGCGSAEGSEAGAQALVDAVQDVLQGCREIPEEPWFTDQVMQAAEPVLSALPDEAGFATLVVLVSDGVRARALVYGDGCVASIDADDELTLWTLSAGGNAPRYLQYDRLRHLKKLWEAEAYSENLRVSQVRYSLAGGASAGPEMTGMRTELLPGRLTRVWQKDWTAQELANMQALVVASDGLQSAQAVSAARLVKSLVRRGRKVSWRLNALYRLGQVLQGYRLTDDLSVGVLRLAEAARGRG